MTTPAEQNGHDRDPRLLWERYVAQVPDGGGTSDPGCPSPLTLAAYIDARVTDGERATIDDHLTGCPVCTSAIRETGRLLAAQRETPLDAPAIVVERARGLMHALHAGPSGGDRDAIAGWLDLRAFGRWGLAAAASIAVCLLGYQAGAGSSTAGSSAAGLPETDLVAELTFGLDTDESTAIEDLLFAGIDPEEADS